MAGPGPVEGGAAAGERETEHVHRQSCGHVRRAHPPVPFSPLPAVSHDRPPFPSPGVARAPQRRRSWEKQGGAIVVEPPSFHNDPAGRIPEEDE